jgi:hypothetical protein
VTDVTHVPSLYKRRHALPSRSMKLPRWLRKYDRPTQPMPPKGSDREGNPAEPTEIPIATRDAVLDSLERAANRPVPQDEPLKDQGDALAE